MENKPLVKVIRIKTSGIDKVVVVDDNNDKQELNQGWNIIYYEIKEE